MKKSRGRIGYLGCLFVIIGFVLVPAAGIIATDFQGGFSSFIGLGCLALILLGAGVIMMIIPFIKRAQDRAEQKEAERLARITRMAEDKLNEG